MFESGSTWGTLPFPHFSVCALRVRAVFFPLIFVSSVSLMCVYFFQPTYLNSPQYSVNLADWQEIVPCDTNTRVSLVEILYDDEQIAKTHVLREDSKITKKMWKRMKPATTASERRTIRAVLAEFIKICDANNFTYFLMSGSLLGSYRHHGLMPWDDDVDILMPHSQRSRILTTFRMYARTHDTIGIGVGNQARMKVFHKYRSVGILGWNYRWPTIDISFYFENLTHIWERRGRTRYHEIQKNLIFPVHPRPFEMLMIKSPFDGFAVLRLLYRDPTCVTLSWVHRAERGPGEVIKFNCELVSEFYPFVHRRVRGRCVEESLVLGDTVLHTLTVNEPLYAISDPYVLELITNGTDSTTNSGADQITPSNAEGQS